MTTHLVETPHERFEWDDTTGTGAIHWRADTPPWDAPLAKLDGHFLGARLLGPVKHPFKDAGGDTNAQGSPGSVHAVVAECLLPYEDVATNLLLNAQCDMLRGINWPKVQEVCWLGGLPPCPKSGPAFAWNPDHEFRGWRHLVAWLRFGWESERFLASCAIARALGDPSIMEGKSGVQRGYGWLLLLLDAALDTPLGATPEVVAGIGKIVDVLWAHHGPTWLIQMTPAEQKQSNHRAICSWMHALPVRGLGRLVRRGWPDPRVAVLYKAGMAGLDAMQQPGTFTWWKDWDPATGEHTDVIDAYAGTSLWTACAWAESLDLLTAAAPARRAFLQGFVQRANCLHPADVNYDAAAHALIAARLAT